MQKLISAFEIHYLYILNEHILFHNLDTNAIDAINHLMASITRKSCIPTPIEANFDISHLFSLRWIKIQWNLDSWWKLP